MHELSFSIDDTKMMIKSGGIGLSKFDDQFKI